MEETLSSCLAAARRSVISSNASKIDKEQLESSEQAILLEKRAKSSILGCAEDESPVCSHLTQFSAHAQ